jgi:hypothetical protein
MNTIKFNPSIHDESLRCGAITQKGKCEHLSVPGVTRCPHHGANRQLEHLRRRELDSYNVERFKMKIGEQHARSLVEEVIVLKTMLAVLIQECDGSTSELAIRQDGISNLVLKIEKAVTACTKLEIMQQTMVDKSTVERYVNMVLEILTENIEDKEKLKNISKALQVAFEEVTKIDEDM